MPWHLILCESPSGVHFYVALRAVFLYPDSWHLLTQAEKEVIVGAMFAVFAYLVMIRTYWHCIRCLLISQIHNVKINESFYTTAHIHN